MGLGEMGGHHTFDALIPYLDNSTNCSNGSGTDTALDRSESILACIYRKTTIKRRVSNKRPAIYYYIIATPTRNDESETDGPNFLFLANQVDINAEN